MKRTVLIVEDDVDIQDYLAILLSDLEVEVLRAGDGQEALMIIESGRPVDLILLDVIMPVMDGEAFLRELRQERRSPVPVVLTSVDETIAGRLKGAGEVQGVFLKGGLGEDLRQLVIRLLAERTGGPAGG